MNLTNKVIANVFQIIFHEIIFLKSAVLDMFSPLQSVRRSDWPAAAMFQQQFGGSFKNRGGK